jgi:diguanylate cyclase (GGDEF)-like protein
MDLFSLYFMTQQMAALTEETDREQVELMLARMLQALLSTHRLNVWRLVLHMGEIKLAPMIHIHRDGWQQQRLEDIDNQLMLPRTQPDWYELAIEERRSVSRADTPQGEWRLLPLGGKNGVTGLIELHLPQVLQIETLALLQQTVRLAGNHLNLLDDAQHDTLTGLYNRKTFDRYFTQLLQWHANPDNSQGTFQRRQLRPDSVSWLGIIDIDHFKRINDGFGHLYGDEVLLLTARRLRQAFRFCDRLYRFGGEEFVVVLTPTDATSAQEVFERFRRDMQDAVFPQVGKVTVSIGYSRIRADATASDVLGEADEALYYAKGNGRNQLWNYETLVAAGKLTPKQTVTRIDLY